MQELQARDRHVRETLALLDPSLQATLDANTEVRAYASWQTKHKHKLLYFVLIVYRSVR